MRKFIEKAIIILFCLYNTYTQAYQSQLINLDLDSIASVSVNLVLYFLISLIISLALDLFVDKRIRYFSYFLFIILCFMDNLFIYYLPLILYNMYLDFNIYYTFLTIPLIAMNFSVLNLLLSVISVYISNMTKKFYTVLEENKTKRDALKEDTLYLKKYNKQLKIDREKNVHIAILSERNRIARELHDSIGHAISSSILQVEALKITLADSRLAEGLELLQKTLNNGMNDIRKSIHNLYHESFDLESKIEKLCNEIPTIDIKLVFKLEDNLDYNLKFDIFSIVKEAITNCVKHSNATILDIKLLSQPKFYSIIIKDNGSKFDSNTSPLLTKGIGLASMEEIASKYSGFLNYEFDNGFKIHLTLMKSNSIKSDAIKQSLI